MKTQSLALTLTVLASVLNGCTLQQPTPETAQAVIQSLEISVLAKKPTADNIANKPWRLGVLWLPGGMGGSAILSPGYEHVVTRNAKSPVQNEPASDAEEGLPSLDYPSPYAPDAEGVKVGKPRFCRPCRHAKPKFQSGNPNRHRRTVSHRQAAPCRANQGGK